MFHIDHSIPPVPVPAGSYALWTIPGGYQFLYPIVALAAVNRDEHSLPMWRAVYLTEDSEIEAVDGTFETLNLSEGEAAALRNTIDARNAELDLAEEGLGYILTVAEADGVSAEEVHGWLWDNNVKGPDELRHMFDVHNAVTVDGRVYLDKFAPNTDEEAENR